MTRFEESCKTPYFMAITISFCIAAYVEQLGIVEFSDDELKHFMSVTSEDIEKWLKEESESEDKE